MTDLAGNGALATWLGGLNVVDVVLLVGLLLYGLDGIRRGFIAGALGLIGIVATVFIALRGYPVAAALIRDHFTLPPIVTNIAGFVALLLVAQIAVTILTRILLLALKPVRALVGPINLLDHLLGFVPGIIQGLIIATLVLTPLRLFPVSRSIEQSLDGSRVARAINDRATTIAPQVEEALGRMVEDGMLFRSRIVDDNEEVHLTPQSDLKVDADDEVKMVELVNTERVKAGLKSLVADTSLRAVARQHSDEMFRLGYFSHTSVKLGSPSDRMSHAGISYFAAGENLAYAPTVNVAHTGLMNSPGHRRNILDPVYRRIGVGVVSAGLYGKMFTQNFAG